MNALKKKSLDIILQNQAIMGAFVACPKFETYQYCWFRDGAFIAHAALISGETDSTRRFHLWCAEVVERYREVAERVIKMLAEGRAVSEHDFLPTRFSLDGVSVDDDWTNFQLDGYGTWLWELGEYVNKSGDDALLQQILPAVELTVRYLIASWKTPCYDCWEEHLSFYHPYTLAAISAGLQAVQTYLPELADEISGAINDIQQWLLEHAVQANQVLKMIPAGSETESDKSRGVDASLIGMFVPYGVFAPDSAEAQTTIQRIEKDIHYTDGGVYRYLQDTYYGGGEWLLLTCWLGWYYAEKGDMQKARNLLRWVESQADENGWLAEQVQEHLLAPDYLQEWEERWGKIASPLLWSHAMYLILCDAVGE